MFVVVVAVDYCYLVDCYYYSVKTEKMDTKHLPLLLIHLDMSVY